MTQRKAQAVWNGTLKNGSGSMKLESGNCSCGYSFGSRFEEAKGSNPEEFLGAASAGCFSMAFAHNLEKAGYPPETITTTANVSLEKKGDGFNISTIKLDCQARVDNIEGEQFQKLANEAKENCPVSQALAGADITLSAKLL